MSARQLKGLLPIMKAQRDAAQHRMAEIIARENECLAILIQLDDEEDQQAAACRDDPAAHDGLALWKIWVSGQRSRTNLRLAALRAEREMQARKLAVWVGKLDVSEQMISKMVRDAAAQDARRLEDDGH